ncbi:MULTISPECIES: nucleotidyltransferase family protein [unclassified Microbacterium]|uniref:nucleotidyltransferase family protein n=1 Tax=unclassified Microbacterium TaxID=2609290 RepID=UPI001E4FF904|nr:MULTISPECIES: nucleotidyltransferase family protein [unclassified Microbacterium]
MRAHVTYPIICAWQHIALHRKATCEASTDARAGPRKVQECQGMRSEAFRVWKGDMGRPEELEAVPLRLPEATLLAHALGARVAEQVSARVLSIKGPAADHHALREPRLSVDADLLVDPPAFESFCAALEAQGWHERVARSTPTILEPHSRTYIHPRWPCDIDVHERFPGFFADPADVFDELWNRREALHVGGVALTIPALVPSMMIGALHALRNMSVPRHRAEWDSIIEMLQSRLDDSGRQDFLRLADAGRSRWVLREALEIIGFGPVENDLSTSEADSWSSNLRFGADGGAAGWLIALRRGPMRERALTLVRAVWVPKEFVPRNEKSVPLSTQQVMRYQIQRWRRGLRATLNYVRNLRG